MMFDLCTEQVELFEVEDTVYMSRPDDGGIPLCHVDDFESFIEALRLLRATLKKRSNGDEV